MHLALIPASDGEWGLWFAVVAALLFLWLVGNLIFGGLRAGGSRLVLFLIGAGVSAVGVMICRYCWDSPKALTVSETIGVLAGILVVATGSTLIWTSFAASNATVEKAFQAVLRGL